MLAAHENFERRNGSLEGGVVELPPEGGVEPPPVGGEPPPVGGDPPALVGVVDAAGGGPDDPLAGGGPDETLVGGGPEGPPVGGGPEVGGTPASRIGEQQGSSTTAV